MIGRAGPVRILRHRLLSPKPTEACTPVATSEIVDRRTRRWTMTDAGAIIRLSLANWVPSPPHLPFFHPTRPHAMYTSDRAGCVSCRTRPARSRSRNAPHPGISSARTTLLIAVFLLVVPYTTGCASSVVVQVPASASMGDAPEPSKVSGLSSLREDLLGKEVQVTLRTGDRMGGRFNRSTPADCGSIDRPGRLQSMTCSESSVASGFGGVSTEQ